MLSRASPVAGPHLGRPASLPPVRVPLAQWPCWARGLLPREPFPVPCGYRVCRIPLRAGDLAGFAGFPVGVGWKIARYPEGSRGATRWSCRFSTFLSPSTGLTWPDASCLIDLSSGFSHRSVISLNCWSDDRCDLSLDDSQETKRSSRRVIAGVRCPSTLLGPGLWPAAGIFAVRALRPMPDCRVLAGARALPVPMKMAQCQAAVRSSVLGPAADCIAAPAAQDRTTHRAQPGGRRCPARTVR